MQKLALWGNDIGPDGAKAVAAMAAVTGSLTQLVHNCLGPQGAQHLSEALKMNKSITELDISNANGFTSGDIKA